MRLWPLTLLSWGCLDYESFLIKKNDKQCEAQQSCNPDVPCDQDTGEPDCDFDADAARECLSGLFVCDDRFVGFEEARPPQVCVTVCGGTIE